MKNEIALIDVDERDVHSFMMAFDSWPLPYFSNVCLYPTSLVRCPFAFPYSLN